MIMRGAWRFCSMLAAVVACHMLLIGCDKPKPTATVEGTVTFDGEPVTEAVIQFQSPETGQAAGGMLDADGKYKLDSPLTVGEYSAMIIPHFEAPPAGSTTEVVTPPERPDIPARYRQAATSGFTLEVVPGVNVFDAEMTSEK